MACEEVFLEKLRARGLRLTPQREMILSAMHEIKGLATVEEVYARVQAVTSAVDVSTVYRTLDLLQAFDIVACIDCGDGQHRYELLGVHGPHIHLICQSCGKVVGVDLQEAQPLAEQFRARYGFAADLDHLTISGLCQACAERAAKTP
ncbi:MAG: transcriptional repressor [Anaerolineae bacterium]|nr:transcriptional repressor [Anaerolineae bacterium]